MNSNITIISPNMIKLFLECPRKFYFKYIEQIPSPILDKTFETGKNLHALASYYLKGCNIEKFENSLQSKEQEYWNLLKNVPYFKYEIVGTEKNMTSKINNYWIGGRIDAIVKNNNDYYILDYKTGGVSDNMDYEPQTMIYLIMCDELFKNYNSLTFVYIDLKNKKEAKTVFSSKLKTDYIEKIQNICSKIQNFNIKKTVKKDRCSCEYIGICEYS